MGGQGGTHIASSLWKAAENIGIEAHFCDMANAFAAPAAFAMLSWKLLGHRPPYLTGFSRQVVETCRAVRPTWLLSTGLAPINAEALDGVGKLGIMRCNYLTDDPWNPTHASRWFLKALPHYDCIFTPRQSNLPDLNRLGCTHVKYLAFGYDPLLFFSEPVDTPEKRRYFSSDVVFVGSADEDRLPFIRAIIRGGFDVAIYGPYWDRFSETKHLTRGIASPEIVRAAIGGAKVALCLVRRSNRDGNSMRTFEVPAIGACMLTEDTAEHRDIFGAEGEAVLYFNGVREMVEKLRWLLEHDVERHRMKQRCHQLITDGHHTYQDRLAVMLGLTMRGSTQGC